jgi:hypothetical protein
MLGLFMTSAESLKRDSLTRLGQPVVWILLAAGGLT